MICQVNFSSDWINASALEEALRGDREPHGKDSYETQFLFPVGCKIMVDAAVRLLSLINQLDHCSRRVRGAMTLLACGGGDIPPFRGLFSFGPYSYPRLPWFRQGCYDQP